MPSNNTTHDGLPDLTDRQREVLGLLDTTKREIAESLGIAKTTVEGHLNNLQEKGIGVRWDPESELWILDDDRAPQLRRISTKHKQTKTREANELIEAEESILLRRLKRREPLNAPHRPESGNESFVAVTGDWHFGDVVETDAGHEVYNMELAADAVATFAEKCLHIRDLESKYTSFDDCHLVLLGDVATGTHIYSGQVHDIEAFLADQVTRASQALVDLVGTLADAFESVHVHAVLGNHGLDRASAARGSNTDLICYRWMDDALRRSDIENVSVQIAESNHHLNTTIRGHRVHVRHGQDGRPHIDKTSRSESDWRGWQIENNFDVAMRGHYHTPGLDWVLNEFPVISSPSPKPGSEFASRIGRPDVSHTKHLGWCVGVGDTRKLTFKRLVDDQ